MTIRYGRRIRKGNNGDVVWCDLSEKDVLDALQANIALNATIFHQCVEQAFRLMNVEKPEDQAIVAFNQQLKQELHQVALALFRRSAVESTTALQERLDEKAHWQKTHAMM